ncbi:hypothetical protein CFC21_105324 [Triticum aestivum]|uniref:U1-type domain-containing protein n=3 Tax=Triticum TaxID=4564 RepID=A0A9R1AB60_TRITD|nr:zinc finger RNA-binding protein-like isoform X1 [Triticum aestivum]KAF7104427.1 hypothetical protein CFC21_105324 [Triticum aestivum]VAI92904.1 unnamed protein product [Triticum turgidum subsp. durum]
MEFRFRAGDRGPPGSSPPAPGGSPPARFSLPRDGYTGAGAQGTQAGPSPSPLPRPPLEWEAARREHLIREEVRRRLVEEEVRREFEAEGDLAFARGGWGPDPFLAPGCFMPPPTMPMPMRPPPYAPPPPVPFDEFGAWQGFVPRRHAGFGERMPFPCEERRWSPPRQKPKHKLQLLEIEPSGTPVALSPKLKVPKMKRKAAANAAATVPKKVQKLAKDWSCALCQVSATCEAGLNEHLGGRKHKAKLAQCGASKAIKDDKNCLQATTGNKNSTDPCDAPKKVHMLVDGEMHEVVQKNNYLWCDRCRVRCDSNVIMAGHLRSKKHSKLNKVWTSIKAVRTNTDTKEGLPSCGSLVNTNDCTEIPAVIEGDINMTSEVDESSPAENPAGKEIKSIATEVEIPAVIDGGINMTSGVDESSLVENPAGKEITSIATEVESITMATEVHENNPVETPVETKKESTDMTNDV